MSNKAKMIANKKNMKWLMISFLFFLMMPTTAANAATGNCTIPGSGCMSITTATAKADCESRRGTFGSCTYTSDGTAPTPGGTTVPSIYIPGSGETGLPDSPGGIPGILSNFLDWLLLVIGFIAIIGFAISGILYFTAAGSEDQAKTAKKAMLYSIIGVVVTLAAFVIVQAVDAALNGYWIF